MFQSKNKGACNTQVNTVCGKQQLGCAALTKMWHLKAYEDKVAIAFSLALYLRVYKPHFFEKNLPSKIGVWLIHGI
jgi:hypothetical protein